MSFIKQGDVKNHLSHRTRSQIHLIQPASQPDATGFSGVESGLAEPTAGNPVKGALKQSPTAEFEALRNSLGSDSRNVVPSATFKSVRD
jgi:hypothetical protein